MGRHAQAARTAIAVLSEYLLVVTEDSYGKRMPVATIPRTGRGRQGVAISPSVIAAAAVVSLADEVVIATTKGMVQRLAVAEIAEKGRRALGSRIIKLADHDKLAKVVRVPSAP